MNIKAKVLVFFGYLLILAIQGIGVLVAYQVIAHYKYLANGILGFLVLSYVYHLYMSPKRQVPPDERVDIKEVLFIFPSNIKLLAFGFFWAASSFWALWEVVNAILYLIRDIRLYLGL